jgi:hypothetical protein
MREKDGRDLIFKINAPTIVKKGVEFFECGFGFD